LDENLNSLENKYITITLPSNFFIYNGVKSILHYLFNFNTKLNPTPGNKSLPVNLIYLIHYYNLKNITPALNTSHTLSYFNVLSTKLAISGATYPGVPHFGNKNLSIVQYEANPKSTIFNEFRSYFFNNIIFSGFKSLCIISLSCIYSIPVRICLNNY